MNRSQRRKAGITYTKKDLIEAHKHGFEQGFRKGVDVTTTEIEKALKSEFGFGKKRLKKLTAGINRKGETT